MKKAKKILISALVIALVGSTALTGCASNTKTSGGNNSQSNDKTLTLYTPDSESLVNATIPKFEKDTGIKVNVITAGTGELEKRIKSEKNDPQGDIMWGADSTMLAPMKDLFTPYISKNNDNMEDKYKNKDGCFTPVVADGTVILINTDIIGNIKVEGWKDLLDPKLKGKIAFCDPTNSSSAFEQVVNMLYDMGMDNDPNSKQAWNYIDEFIKNLNGKIANSSGTVHKSVADGEYPVGLSWEDPCLQYVKNGAHVKVVYPKEGVIFTDQTVQIIKNCKHLNNAKEFVDYITSEKMEDIFGSQLTNRPLRKKVKLASYIEPFSSMNMMKKYNPVWVGKNKQEIINTWNEHYSKAQD